MSGGAPMSVPDVPETPRPAFGLGFADERRLLEIEDRWTGNADVAWLVERVKALNTGHGQVQILREIDDRTIRRQALSLAGRDGGSDG